VSRSERRVIYTFAFILGVLLGWVIFSIIDGWPA